MSNRPSCPQCGKSFPDEDYCPQHGVQLVHEAPEPLPEVREPAPEATVAEATPRASEPEPDAKLAGFMQRLGLRRIADRASLGKSEPPASDVSPLPEPLREQGWQVAGRLQARPGVDRWPVERPLEDETAETGHYHRYRTGALTPDALYRRLVNEPAPQLAQVIAHGTVDIGGARADYELVSGPQAGTSLNRWLADSSPSEQRAMHLFPGLVELVGQLAAAGVRPLTLEPALLTCTADNRLWLACAAALADTEATSEFHPEYARSALLAHGWTAPELTQQNMLSASAAVFALGQVLAQAVWGQPCSIAELQTGAIPLGLLSDTRLARILMGCLWPQPDRRWTVDDLSQAAASASVETMPSAPPWESLAPGASSMAFQFAGASYWRLEDLLTATAKPENWLEATRRVEAILAWAEDTAWAGRAKLMTIALEQHRSADWVLAALRRAVCPNAPLAWRGLDLSEEQAERSLTGLAQRALRAESKTDVATIRTLFEADLRGAFTFNPHGQ